MKILHIAGGGDIGGAKTHILSLVHELGRTASVKLVSLRSGPFADGARAMGITVEVIRTGNILRDIKRLHWIIRNEGYDIIHSHGAKANLFSVIAGRSARIPLVTTVHSDYRLDYLHNMLKKMSYGIINTVALRFLDYHISVSRNFNEMLIRRRFNTENIFTLYNGLDFSKIREGYNRGEFLKKYGIDIGKDAIIIGMLARLHPVKGIDTLVDAAKIVVSRYPHARFVIGGENEGNYRRTLEKKIRNSGLSRNVLLPGWINDPCEFMSCIDINVLTSISETFSYVILEGAMYRKATVSTNVGGIPDLVCNGETGFLFDPGDARALAGHLIKLIEDPDLRTKLGDAIHIKAETEFSLETMYRTQVEIYEKILEDEKEGRIWRKDYDAIISGYYGFRNIGDDAMLQSIISDLRKYGRNARMLILSRNPLECELNFKVNSIGRYNLLRIVLAMRNSRLLIYGGGTLIQEATSTRSLVYYLGMIWIAKKMGLRVMLYANGIEPMSRRMNRLLTNRVLNQVDVITLREASSLDELTRLGIKKPQITITADAALSVNAPLPSSDKETARIFESESIPAGRPIIGISVRKWPGFAQFAGKIAQAADYASETFGAIPLFISMQYPDDLDAAAEVMSRMKRKAYIIKGGLNAPQTLGVIGRMELLIGMRLHALVFAAELGIPVVGIPYQEKVQSFLKYIGQERYSVGDMAKVDDSGLIAMLADIWGKRQSIGSCLRVNLPQLRTKASENAKIAAGLLESADRGGSMSSSSERENK